MEHQVYALASFLLTVVGFANSKHSTQLACALYEKRSFSLGKILFLISTAREQLVSRKIEKFRRVSC